MSERTKIGYVYVQKAVLFLAVVLSVVTTVVGNIANNAYLETPLPKFSGEDFPCQNQQNEVIIKLEENLKQLSEQAELLQSEIATKQDIISKAFTESKRLTDENNGLRTWNEEKAKLISQFRESYFTNKYEDTELHFAANRNDEEAIKKLIHLGIDINARNNLQETALHRAAVAVKTNKSVALKIIKYLVEEGADVFKKEGDYKRTFLHILASKASLTPNEFHKMTDYLIQKNLTSIFTITDNHNKTPLMIAVETMEVEMATLSLLQSKGINFDYPGSVLYGALWGKRDVQYVSSLIALGADWNYTTAWNGEGLLHVAAHQGNLEVLKLLLKLGLDINGGDNNWLTPLHKVAYLGALNKLETAQFLIENGADIDIQDIRRVTAFDSYNSLPFTIESDYDASMIKKMLKPSRTI